MSAPIERPAEQLWVNDLIGRERRHYRCERVAVTTETVEIVARRLDGATPEIETLHFAAGELVRMARPAEWSP